MSKAPELKLDKVGFGKTEPYCYHYDPLCKRCGKSVSVRAVKDRRVEGVPAVEILFQCDRCKLKWKLEAFTTSNHIQRSKASKPWDVPTDLVKAALTAQKAD